MADKYQCGDIITVKAMVYSDRSRIDGTIKCSFNAPLAEYDKITLCVAEEDIVTHTPKPRPIKVGDTVVVSGFARYEVLAIHEDKAWLKSLGGSHIIYDLDKLERV